MKNKEKRKIPKILKHPIILSLVALLLVGLIVLFFWPLSDTGIHIKPNPSKSYDESIKRVSTISTSEDPKIMPECHSYVNTTGKKTDNVIVVYHGFTNCPIQYKQFSDQLVSQGYNVLVLRMPRHGEKDKANNDLHDITTEEIAKYANDSVDIASGLGDNIYLTGLSVGGAVTSWTGQERKDVKGYINMAPFYAPKFVPEFIITPMIRILNVLPPITIWWDSKTKENNVTGSPYAYAGLDTRSLAKFLSFGDFVKQDIAKGARAVGQTLVLNENDASINNTYAARMERNIFLAADKYNLTQYTFAKSEGLNHDTIDPYNPEQNTKYTYPILINLIINQINSR